MKPVTCGWRVDVTYSADVLAHKLKVFAWMCFVRNAMHVLAVYLVVMENRGGRLPDVDAMLNFDH
jgi:hypothetical protein